MGHPHSCERFGAGFRRLPRTRCSQGMVPFAVSDAAYAISAKTTPCWQYVAPPGASPCYLIFSTSNQSTSYAALFIFIRRHHWRMGWGPSLAHWRRCPTKHHQHLELVPRRTPALRSQGRGRGRRVLLGARVNPSTSRLACARPGSRHPATRHQSRQPVGARIPANRRLYLDSQCQHSSQHCSGPHD